MEICCPHVIFVVKSHPGIMYDTRLHSVMSKGYTAPLCDKKCVNFAQGLGFSWELVGQPRKA